MNEVERAEEHLRIIRTLMERATIYRAISAPSALVGGLLSLGVSVGSIIWTKERHAIPTESFVALWCCVLTITAGVNAYFLRREAQRRGEPFVSAGMKLALVSLTPSLLTGGFLTVLFAFTNSPHELYSLTWTLFYALALLSTCHFAPRSICILGWMFLCAVLLYLMFSALLMDYIPERVGAHSDACFLALTFGLFHLVYAACTWPRKTAHDAESQ